MSYTADNNILSDDVYGFIVICLDITEKIRILAII